MKQIVVDGFHITGNLFERNDTDLNFQNNNYSDGTFGVLRGIVVEKNVFLYTGGGASSLHVIRSNTDEIFGGSAWSVCFRANQPRYTKDCRIVNNSFYYPLHSVFISQLEEGQTPKVSNNRFYSAKQTRAFGIWKLDGTYGFFTWITWNEAANFLKKYLGDSTNKVILPK